MKLLFIVHTMQRGGIATVLKTRLNAIATKSDFEIHILSELPNDDSLVAEFHPRIRFHTLDLKKILSKKRLPIIGYKFIIKEIYRLYENFINQLKPTIITDYDWGYYREIIPFLKTEAFKIKELHGAYASKKLLNKKKSVFNFFTNSIPEKLHNRYEIAITVTAEDAIDRSYLTIPKKHIYNPIDLTCVNTIKFKNRKNICLSVGTLTKNKNFKDLIIAVSMIKDKLNDWEFHIYGQGVEKENLQNLIAKYQLESIVFLQGFSNDMSSVYNNSKILISTSLSEGFGMTLVEALNFKTPVISYNFKCGAKEIVNNNINGYVINFSVEELAEKLVDLITNSDKLEEFSNKCHLNINRFSIDTITQQWLHFYTEIKSHKNAH